jgi:hypothetical protein
MNDHEGPADEDRQMLVVFLLRGLPSIRGRIKGVFAWSTAREAASGRP